MPLPACQERILRGMETALRAREPRLASKFAIFTRLTRNEEIPRTEQLPRPQPSWRWSAARLRAFVTLPVALILMAAGLVAVGIFNSHACRTLPVRVVAGPIRGNVSCAANRATAGGSRTIGRSPARLRQPAQP
jgi:hypothetical protein